MVAFCDVDERKLRYGRFDEFDSADRSLASVIPIVPIRLACFLQSEIEEILCRGKIYITLHKHSLSLSVSSSSNRPMQAVFIS